MGQFVNNLVDDIEPSADGSAGKSFETIDWLACVLFQIEYLKTSVR